MIAAFITEQMNAYIAGGMKPETAAHFTRGELAAIYKGKHHSRDAAGNFQHTPPPENVNLETAMKKADAAIMEILKCCAGDAKKEAKAPEYAPAAQEKSGFEKMAEYARNPA
jgi:hypothetical protein